MSTVANDRGNSFAFEVFAMQEALRRAARAGQVKISAADLPVADAFARSMTKGTPGRRMHPGLERLAELTLRTREGARLALGRLERNGALQLEEPTHHRGRLSNTYRFAEPILQMFDATVAEWQRARPQSTSKDVGRSLAGQPPTSWATTSKDLGRSTSNDVGANSSKNRSSTEKKTNAATVSRHMEEAERSAPLSASQVDRTSLAPILWPSGQFKGRPLADADDGYIHWVLSNRPLTAALRQALEAEERSRADRLEASERSRPGSLEETNERLREMARRRSLPRLSLADSPGYQQFLALKERLLTRRT